MDKVWDVKNITLKIYIRQGHFYDEGWILNCPELNELLWYSDSGLKVLSFELNACSYDDNIETYDSAGFIKGHRNVVCPLKSRWHLQFLMKKVTKRTVFFNSTDSNHEEGIGWLTVLQRIPESGTKLPLNYTHNFLNNFAKCFGEQFLRWKRDRALDLMQPFLAGNSPFHFVCSRTKQQDFLQRLHTFTVWKSPELWTLVSLHLHARITFISAPLGSVSPCTMISARLRSS